MRTLECMKKILKRLGAVEDANEACYMYWKLKHESKTQNKETKRHDGVILVQVVRAYDKRRDERTKTKDS